MLNKIKSRLTFFIKGGWRHIVNVSLRGLFWLAPIAALAAISFWILGKIMLLTGFIFGLAGFDPKEYQFLWDLFGIALLITIAYFFGHFVNTRFGCGLIIY